MAFEGRQLVVAGPTMVYLKGGAHYSGQPVGTCAEMGLCQEEVRVEINFLKDDVRSEDFGQQAPADVRFQMATARITMTLLHYDPFVVETAIQESLGGRPFPWAGDFVADLHQGAGKLGMPGALMGGRKAMYASGNRFVAVNVVPAGRADRERQDVCYRFRKCHLSEMPTRISLGSECSLVHLTFRALPYVDPTSGAGPVRRKEQWYSGAVLWDYQDDALADGVRLE